MFCTRARSCARADDAKSCAVGMRNAKPGNHLNLLSCIYFVFAFRLDRLFVYRYFVIHIHFQFLAFPFPFLYSWGRAASSQRTIAIFVCMFFGSFVFAHGCNMAREFRRELNFSTV